jgi:glycosyltransferase involved in cell wall biosynthesis
MIDDDLVTVLIPVRNEAPYIAACLASVMHQTYRNLDIVLVDGESEDKTVAIIRDVAGNDKRVRVVTNPKRITPSSLNVGLREARGQWMVRVDGHSTVPKDYVERAVAHLRSGSWGGVGGRKDGLGVTAAGRAIAAAMASPFGVGNSTYHHGTEVRVVDHIPFGAYPVELARSISGWDERLKVNQDYEFDWRLRQAGHELLFDPAMQIDWLCRQSVGDLWKQYFRYGRGKARVAAMHPRSLAIRHLIPPAAVAWLALALVTLPVRPILTVLAIAPYVMVVAVASAVTARKVGRGERRYLPLIFAAMHIGWGLGFYRGLVDVVFDLFRARSAADA